MTSPLFWPVIDTETQEECVDASAKRLNELDRFAFDTYLGLLGGFRDLPPRKRFALYVAKEQEWGSILPWLGQLEMIDATEAVWAARDYATLQLRYSRGHSNGNAAPVSELGY